MKPTLLILAAGIGSRYGGLKQVDGIGPGGEAILEYSVYDAIRAGFGKVVIVIRKDIEEAFREKVGRKFENQIQTEYAFQELDTALEFLDEKPYREKPWGTGHAILSAKEHLNTPFATVNADDFYGFDAFQTLAGFLSKECTPQRYGMVAFELGKTLSENGAVSRGVCSVNDDGFLTDVTERTKIERYPNGIHYSDADAQRHLLAENTPVSMNFWGFHPAIFEDIREEFVKFVEANQNNPKAEFFIPLFVNAFIKRGKIKVSVLPCNDNWYGVTYIEDKEKVQEAFAKLIADGVYKKDLW